MHARTLISTYPGGTSIEEGSAAARMGNSIGGRRRRARVMTVDGATYKYRPPAAAGDALRDHPGHRLLDAEEVRRLGVRARARSIRTRRSSPAGSTSSSSSQLDSFNYSYRNYICRRTPSHNLEEHGNEHAMELCRSGTIQVQQQGTESPKTNAINGKLAG